MLTLALLGLVLGVVLGRFKVFVLLLAISATAVVIAIVGIGASQSIPTVVLETIIASVCLQFGYVIGIGALHALSSPARAEPGRPAAIH